jgi:two-component system sensor histidine kinase RegB
MTTRRVPGRSQRRDRGRGCPLHSPCDNWSHRRLPGINLLCGVWLHRGRRSSAIGPFRRHALAESKLKSSNGGAPLESSSRSRIDPGFLRTLTQLRWCAAAGQSLAIAVTLHVLALPLPAWPLWAGVAALLAFNVYATAATPGGARNRAAAPASVSARLAVTHLGFDIAELTWAIAWSGGPMNPFVSLFLVPIALATLALPIRHIVLIAVLATLGYALAAALGPALPHIHGLSGTFDLHLWGMAVNFALSAIVLVAVLTQLAAARDAREREIARLREQAARAEGILGLATHAAAMAHALNTPLGTLTLMLDDLAEDSVDRPQLHADIERARAVVAVCRDQVRKLVHEAHPDSHVLEPLAAYVDSVIARWELLRPAMQLKRDIDLPQLSIRADPALAHLLQALLDNAADASVEQARSDLCLHLRVSDDALVGAIVDHGGRALEKRPLGAIFATSKATGLGVGLALSHATVERYGGELTLQAGADGAITRFRLPLSKLR